jgi:DNA polymerase-3 subunit epsilon
VRVAGLLGLPAEAAAQALALADERSVRPVNRFRLGPGDLVAFTGETEVGREAWEARARAGGCVPHPRVTKEVKLLVAADPDTLSGKARRARIYGIPIVTTETFRRLIDQ